MALIQPENSLARTRRDGSPRSKTTRTTSMIPLKVGFGKDVAELLEGVSKHIATLPSLMEQSTSNRAKVADLKEHLQDVRHVQCALVLDSLSTIVKTSLLSLENQFSDAYVRENYAKFPDEISAIIFEFASLERFGSAKLLSRVCRQFRAIALSIPQLWTTIRPKYHCNMEDAITLSERSRCAGSDLTVEVEVSNVEYGGNEYKLSLMDFISAHSSRIRNLTLDLTILDQIQKLGNYSDLTFPNVEFFKTHVRPKYGDNRDLVPISDAYKMWEVPSLRRLQGVNCFPNFPSTTLSHITSFELEAGDCHGDGLMADNRVEWNLNILHRYLCQLTSVEDLSLNLDCDSHHFPLTIGSRYLSLKKLRCLSLKLQKYKSKNAEKLFGIFNYKTLASFSVHVCDEILSDLKTLFGSVWRRPVFPNLKNLDFRIIPTYYDQNFNYESSPLTHILQHFLVCNAPIQSVYLECAEGDHQVFGFSNRLAALHLKNCQLFSREIYMDGFGSDIVYELENVFKRRGEATDECLVLDGAKKSPLDEAEIVRVTISDRDLLYIRGEFAC